MLHNDTQNRTNICETRSLQINGLREEIHLSYVGVTPANNELGVCSAVLVGSVVRVSSIINVGSVGNIGYIGI